MNDTFEHATERLYEALTGPKPPDIRTIVAARGEVVDRYGPLFTPLRRRRGPEY